MNVTRRTLAGAIIAALCVTAVTTFPARAATQWDVAVLVYRSLDLDCNGRHIASTLSSVAHDPASVAQRFASTATSWSDGGANVTVTIFERGKLTSSSPLGAACWPAPSNVTIPAGFDSVIVMYESDAEGAPAMNPYGGLAYEGLFNGYTYATVPIPDGDQWWFWDNAYPELASVHEWLHGVGGYYRDTFPSIPGLHDSGSYGYSDEIAWHSDFTGGDINGSLGLTAQVWASGSPSGGTVVAPSPSVKPCKNPSSQAKACRP